MTPATPEQGTDDLAGALIESLERAERERESMTERGTEWNGEPARAHRVRVIVGESPAATWWCAGLVGTEREAVKVYHSDGAAFLLDNEDGIGWWKVTEGHGLPRWSSRSLPDTSVVIRSGTS